MAIILIVRQVTKIFSQPYPSADSPRSELRQAAVIGLFVGLFLLIFQPFGLDRWETSDKTLKLLGFGLVTSSITAFNFTVWISLFPRQFADQRWTVGRHIMLVTGNILLIAIGNRLYLDWLLRSEGYTNPISWPGMIVVTFLIGVFPTTGSVLYNYIRQLRKYSQSAAGFSTQLPALTHQETTASQPVTYPSGQSEIPIILMAENEKDTLTLRAADLFYIESSDNYCTVVHQNGNQIQKPLLRSSLSRLESQINRPHIVRCHRSYVVNLDRVERVTGNAQGYKLHLSDNSFQVPVARQYNETLVTELKGL